MRFKNEQGFTIVELIVVIAVIAVLAAIIMANVTGYIGKSRDTSAKSSANQISTMATDYILNSGTASNLCASSSVTNLADSVKHYSSSYTFYCYDPASSYIVYKQKENPLIASASAQTGSDDLLGSDDIFDDEEDGTTGSGNANCSSLDWYAYVSGLNSSTGCWCIDSQGTKNTSCGVESTCSCSAAIVMNGNILMATISVVSTAILNLLSKAFPIPYIF